jgi:hypothetical protein
MNTTPAKPAKSVLSATAVTMPGLYLLVFALCGWLVLIANMFGIAGKSGWIFPAVVDIPGLAASTVLLAFLGLTPLAIRQLVKGKGGKSK